ncbi:hypothetical protein GALL_340830 [mine drainage metagenome]|uniref:Uncharacterized protein n=1 Tax=mine drainage metagenome TaxID=410659 RepID=A0A1J5QKV9_9ZZZZ
MLFKRGNQLRAFGFLDRNEVLDRHGIHDLAAEAFGDHAGAYALACRIDNRCRTSRAAADHEDVERRAGADLFGFPGNGAGIQSGEKLLHAHASLAEDFAVEINGRHRHDLAFVDLVLIQRAIDHRVGDVGVEHGHQVQGLHHFRAVLAGERNIGLEMKPALQVADLFDDFIAGPGGVAANLQHGQYQGREFMAHGDAGESDADVAARAVEGKRWRPLGTVAPLVERNQSGQPGNIHKQFEHLARLVMVVKVGDDLDGLCELVEMAFELRLDICIQHDVPVPRVGVGIARAHTARACCRVRSCRPDRATAPAWRRLPSIWPGRPLPDGWRRTGLPGSCA